MIGMDNKTESDVLIEKLHDYVAYVLTSAAGLYREPHLYGPMRLIDSLVMTLELLRLLGVSDDSIDESLADVRKKRWCAGTDSEQFSAALEKSIQRLVEVTIGKNKRTPIEEVK